MKILKKSTMTKLEHENLGLLSDIEDLTEEIISLKEQLGCDNQTIIRLEHENLVLSELIYTIATRRKD